MTDEICYGLSFSWLVHCLFHPTLHYSYTDDDKKVLQRENSRIENVPNLRTRYTNPAYHSDQEDMQMQRFGPEGRNAGYHYDYEEENPYRTIDEPDVGNVSRRCSIKRQVCFNSKNYMIKAI